MYKRELIMYFEFPDNGFFKDSLLYSGNIRDRIEFRNNEAKTKATELMPIILLLRISIINPKINDINSSLGVFVFIGKLRIIIGKMAIVMY